MKVFYRSHKAQVSLEFVFCMFILLLMLYGTVKVFYWVGTDLAQRRMAHDDLLVAPVGENFGICTSPCGWLRLLFNPNCCDHWANNSSALEGPGIQISPNFSRPTKLDAMSRY